MPKNAVPDAGFRTPGHSEIPAGFFWHSLARLPEGPGFFPEPGCRIVGGFSGSLDCFALEKMMWAALLGAGGSAVVNECQRRLPETCANVTLLSVGQRKTISDQDLGRRYKCGRRGPDENGPLGPQKRSARISHQASTNASTFFSFCMVLSNSRRTATNPRRLLSLSGQGIGAEIGEDRAQRGPQTDAAHGVGQHRIGGRNLQNVVPVQLE
jgi:hypothetical protein